MLTATRPFIGRPFTPQEFDMRAQLYFNMCDESGTSATLTGLAYYTGFRSTAGLNEYKFAEGWADVVQGAITFVAMNYERRLTMPGATGAMFALKNIDGWTDRQTVSVEGGPDTTDNVASITVHLQRLVAMREQAAAIARGSAEEDEAIEGTRVELNA